MLLTAKFKLRANNHDRERIKTAMARWSSAVTEAMDRARKDQQTLLRCIVLWKSKDGKRERLRVDKDRLHPLVLDYVCGLPVGLHSSAKMSLVVDVQAKLDSWLGLHIAWIDGKRIKPKPGFPTMPLGSGKEWQIRWERAIERSRTEMTLDEENKWRTEVSRTSHERHLPFYFGAMTSGATTKAKKTEKVRCDNAHCGLLRRDDGRCFALLTLWPQGEPRAEPLRRAGNRTERGRLVNVRSPDAEFDPTDRSRSSMIVPLEFSQGHSKNAHGRENLFLRRGAIPKTAHLVALESDYFLHVAFEFPDHPPRRLTGKIMAVNRGLETLLAYVVLNTDGTEAERGYIEGRDLLRLVTSIRSHRAAEMSDGHTLKGNRDLLRAKEHHLFSAAHQMIDVACRHGAEMILLKSRNVRKATPFLAYRSFHRLAGIISYLATEAGLPPIEERPLYGSPKTCSRCGLLPDEAEPTCSRCGGEIDDYHTARLVAMDALRLKQTPKPKGGEQRIPLGGFIESLHLAP